MLNITIRLQDAAAHLWQVTCAWKVGADAPQQTLNLADWVPGSYMIRDFSRHIIRMQAFHNERETGVQALDKSRWSLQAACGDYRVEYEVYAYDWSVRASYLDEHGAFFDGACLFPWLDGRQDEAYHIDIDLREWGREQQWQISTAMQQTAHNRFQAASYWEAIDHPFTLGLFRQYAFQAAGIPHTIIISGQTLPFDEDRLLADVEKICEAQIELFGAAPFGHYVFMLYIGDHIYGGLEHRASTALMADRWSLPRLGAKERHEAYLQLLGLFSHEYFHAWNVKSIKPAVFDPYELHHEQHTEQLWAFEGITSYYDDLMLQRSGVMSTPQYLSQLAKTITRVEQGAGSMKQSLAQSSFDAWTKYYKQNENSANAIVSYYQKGALAALVLDLYLRRETDGEFSLDDVMRALYRRYLQDGRGISEADWRALASEVTGVDVRPVLHNMIDTTAALPLAEVLAEFGLRVHRVARPEKEAGWVASLPAHPVQETAFGAKYSVDASGLKISSVANGGSAELAGLTVGDTVVAMANLSMSQFEAVWHGLQVGDSVGVHYFRQGVLYQTEMPVLAQAATTVLLHTEDEQLLSYWLPQWQ